MGTQNGHIASFLEFVPHKKRKKSVSCYKEIAKISIKGNSNIHVGERASVKFL